MYNLAACTVYVLHYSCRCVTIPHCIPSTNSTEPSLITGFLNIAACITLLDLSSLSDHIKQNKNNNTFYMYPHQCLPFCVCYLLLCFTSYHINQTDNTPVNVDLYFINTFTLAPLLFRPVE